MTAFRSILLGCALALAAGAAEKRSWTDAEVMNVHRSALLIDTHNDVPLLTVAGWDIATRNQKGHTDLARLKEGGVGATFFAAYVAASYAREKRAAARALEMIDAIRTDIVARHPGDFALALTADDILRARKQGKIAALVGVEGGHAIEDNLRLLRCFYDLGARYMTLTHTNTNGWADSSGDLDHKDVAHHNGLTDFGRQVIGEMNHLGMMVDVAHVSDKTFWDVLAASKAPIFSSHSSCRALSKIPRNLSDEMIVAMARKGGVVQINIGCEFLSQKSADASPWINPALLGPLLGPGADRAARRKKEEEVEARMPRATLADMVAHIDHVVKLAGVEAVGIGTDFDGVGCTPVGLEDVSKFPNLTRALLERGYSPADIRKIYGENMLRLMRAVARQR